MRATLAMFMVMMCLMPLSLMVNEPTSAANIMIETTRFGDGADNLTVEFLSGGMDSSNSLDLQTGLYVDYAKARVRTMTQTAGSKTAPANISIDFGGDGLAEWQWKGPGVGGLGMQTLFSNNQPYYNYSFTSAGVDTSGTIRLPKNCTVTSATMNISSGASVGVPGKIICLYGEYSYYSWADNVVNKLKSFPEFTQVDKKDCYSSTPTWDEIKDYSAILLWTDWNYGYPFQNPTALGNLMADYVDAGGSVVLADYAIYASGNYWLGGRFNTEGYYCIQPYGGVYTWMNGALGTVSQPGHPVLKDISSISFPYGQSHVVATSTVASGASPICYYSTGYILAAEKSINGVNRVDLNFWPVPYDGNAYWGTGSDLDNMVHNALLYCGRKAVNVSFDMLNDGSVEFTNDSFTSNTTIPNFSNMLNQYIAGANVTYTDLYGNSFVDIPMCMTSSRAGRCQLNNLKIKYDYQTMIDQNPATGNLTMSLGDLVPTEQGTNNVTIPIYISSTTAGRFMIDQFYMRMSPPYHTPSMNSFFPAQDASVHEGTQVDFGVNATDIYGNPLTYQWFFDGAEAAGNTTDRFSAYFDYDSAGTHTARAVIKNGITEKSNTVMNWNIQVLNKDRAPVIEQTDPAIATLTMKEGANQTFSVKASDLDGDLFRYAWSLDGIVQTKVVGNNFTYFTDFYSSGRRTVTVTVTDIPWGNSNAMTWTVTVENVNQPPLITDWFPKGDPTMKEKDSLDFSVTPSDPDNQTTTTTWFLNGAQVGTGTMYTYKTDFRSAGTYIMKASVADGNLTVSHEWKVTVLNLNRLPVAIIDSPNDMAEYMEGQTIHFSAKASYDPDDEKLTYTWWEGTVNISDQVEFDRSFSHGVHILMVEVKDQSGGVTWATVHFKVRWVELSLVVGLDRLDIAGGDKVDIIVTMSNVGDTNSGDNSSLELRVDGKLVSTKTVSSIPAGGSSRETFQWNAKQGTHTITAKIGDQTWNRPVTVAAPPAPPPVVNINDLVWPIIIVVIAVMLLGWGAAIQRKK